MIADVVDTASAGGNVNSGFCIYVTTICQGPIPIERNEAGNPVVYATREQAEREIAGDCIERLEQFLAGERTFDDAITIEEYAVPVIVHSDGSITDKDGNSFPAGNC